jgi:hypothetical protein
MEQFTTPMTTIPYFAAQGTFLQGLMNQTPAIEFILAKQVFFGIFEIFLYFANIFSIKSLTCSHFCYILFP